MVTQIEDADFIIIGSGSAGSAMAYRLSEDKKYSVLVLEYGGTDIGPFIQMPAALSFPMNMKRYDWGYLAEPEATLNNRRLVCPRGDLNNRVLKGRFVQINSDCGPVRIGPAANERMGSAEQRNAIT